MSEYNEGDNPCGFCQSEIHVGCDCSDCTCNCPYGNKPKNKEVEKK